MIWLAVLAKQAGRCRDKQQLLHQFSVTKFVLKRFKQREGCSVQEAHDIAEKECDNCAKIRFATKHDNLVEFQFRGKDPAPPRLPFLVFEFCDGGDLRRFVQARKERAGAVVFLSSTEAAAIALQLSSGLRALHDEAGFAHGDLALRNVFWRRNERGIVSLKLGDFGFCKPHDAASSGDSSKFSVHNPRDPKTVPAEASRALKDVFAIGLIMVELLTLENLSQSKNGSQMREWGPGHDADRDWVCCKHALSMMSQSVCRQGIVCPNWRIVTARTFALWCLRCLR